MISKSAIIQKIGDRFGRLTVISNTPNHVKKGHKKKLFWLCRCERGVEKYFYGHTLRNGGATSCGCKITDLKKYSISTSLSVGKKSYSSWTLMLSRCYDKRHKNYKNYGGRGITVCDRWKNSFQNFLDDIGERPIGMTIGRIDNNGHYEPSNCKWETNDQQSSNKRNTAFVDGQKLIDLCREKGIDRNIVYQRCKAMGWSLEKAISQPVRKYKKKFPIDTQ